MVTHSGKEKKGSVSLKGFRKNGSPWGSRYGETPEDLVVKGKKRIMFLERRMELNSHVTIDTTKKNSTFHRLPFPLVGERHFGGEQGTHTSKKGARGRSVLKSRLLG